MSLSESPSVVVLGLASGPVQASQSTWARDRTHTRHSKLCGPGFALGSLGNPTDSGANAPIPTFLSHG
jgi:hypothetical protein